MTVDPEALSLPLFNKPESPDGLQRPRVEAAQLDHAADVHGDNDAIAGGLRRGDLRAFRQRRHDLGLHRRRVARRYTCQPTITMTTEMPRTVAMPDSIDMRRTRSTTACAAGSSGLPSGSFRGSEDMKLLTASFVCRGFVEQPPQRSTPSPCKGEGWGGGPFFAGNAV